MFERLKRLYLEGKLDENGIRKAYEIGWITEEEMNEILSSKEDSEEE